MLSSFFCSTVSCFFSMFFLFEVVFVVDFCLDFLGDGVGDNTSTVFVVCVKFECDITVWCECSVWVIVIVWLSSSSVSSDAAPLCSFCIKYCCGISSGFNDVLKWSNCF